MRRAVAELPELRLEALWLAMMKRKHLHRYYDIARIWIVWRCKKVSARAAIAKAQDLQVPRQTRHKWFGEGLKQWLLEMERFHANKEPGDGSIDSAVRKLSAVDIHWIGIEYRRRPSGAKSFRKFTVHLRSIARKTYRRGHLQNVSHVAVWRCCKDLRGDGKHMLADFIIKKAPDVRPGEM
jgi:hypothetical protein